MVTDLSSEDDTASLFSALSGFSGLPTRRAEVLRLEPGAKTWGRGWVLAALAWWLVGGLNLESLGVFGS